MSSTLAAACLAAAALLLAAPLAAQKEVTGFGSNPGNLRMFKFVPAGRRPHEGRPRRRCGARVRDGRLAFNARRAAPPPPSPHLRTRPGSAR